MDLNYLKRLVKIFDDSTLDDLEIEEEGVKLKLARKPFTSTFSDKRPTLQNTEEIYIPVVSEHIQTPQVNLTPAENKSLTQESPKEDFSGLIEIKSPMVGTFYQAPSPEAKPFVEVGSHISKGQTLCIIEAMKLMNQIESEINGTIEKFLVENSKPVEFGQPLFLVKPD